MKKTKEDSLLTKEWIMEKALDVFIKKGYSKTTTQDIADSMQMTRGALYVHFKDKDDLFKQVITKELHFISELIVDSFEAEADEKKCFEQLLINVVDNFYNNKRFRKVILLTWFRVEVEIDCHIMRDKTNFNEFFIEEVQKILVQAHKKGMLKQSVKALESSIHVTALVLGIYRLYFVTPSYMRDVKTSKVIMSDFVNQIFK